MSVPTTNTPRSDDQVVFKNLTSVHLECLIEHPGSERVGCLNILIGNFLQRTPVAPESLEESVTLLAPGQAFRPESQSPGQRWLFRERFSGKLLFRHVITADSEREQFFQLQSKDRDEEVEVLFSNETTLDLELYWVDFDGRERLMQMLAPGETYKRHTFVNHIWMARDAYSKIPLDVIVVDPVDDTYPIRSDHLVSRPGEETVNVVFKNVTPIPLTFNWVDPMGEEITKFTLEPGAFTKEGMNTGPGHVWRVRGGPENEEIKLVLPSVKASQFYEVKMAEFEGNPATEVTFVNETMLDVDLILVGPTGDHFRFKGLSPKESFVQATFATHEWLVREARTDVLLATFTAQATPTTVHINSSHVRSQPGAPPTRARFDNRSPFIIRVVSIDPEGQKTELEELLPGQDGGEHESTDHVWRFIDDMTGREISQFIARPGESLHHELLVRSVHSRSPASISVHNETHLTVDVFWLDYEGKEQRMQTLATGAACTMDTYLTHPWLVRDARSGHLLESIFGQMAAQQINITDDDIISYHRGGQTRLTVTNSLPFSVELYELPEEDEAPEKRVATLAANDDIQLDVQTGVVLRARQRRSQQLIANLIPKDEVDEFELKLRAVHSHYATEIEFVNESPLTVKLYRVDFDGIEHEEDTLKPFDFVVRDTFATHPWVVRDENSDVPVANTIGLSRPQTLRIKADHLYHMQRPDAKMVTVKFINGSRIALDVFRVDENGEEVGKNSGDKRSLFTTRTLEPGSLEAFFSFNFNEFVPQDHTFPAGSIFRAYKAGTRQLADVYILNDTDGQEYTLRNKLVREGLRPSGELREGEVALFSEKNFQGKAWIARTDVPFFRDFGDADNFGTAANDILKDIQNNLQEILNIDVLLKDLEKTLNDIKNFFNDLGEIFLDLLPEELKQQIKEKKEEEERKKIEQQQKQIEMEEQRKELQQNKDRFFDSLDNQISSIKVGPNTQAIIFGGAKFGGVNDVILMDAPDLSLTDVGDDRISSLKIVTTATALETNIRSSATLSEEYLTEKDAAGKTTLVRDTGGDPITFPVYRSAITLPPDVNEIDVWATEALTIEVEGETYDIDPVKPARLKPNLAQKLLINIKATGLGAPALQLRTNTMRERDRFLVFPDQDVSRKLAALQPGKMWQDRAQLGLPEGLSEKDVDHLQYAVQTVAGAAGYQESSSPREGRYIITDNMEYAAWSLDFGGDGTAGGPSYKPLSDSALADLTVGAVLIDDGLTQDFFSDAWNATKQGARAVGEGTVSAAKSVDRVVVQPVARKTVETAETVDKEVFQPTAKFAKKEIIDPVNDNVIQPAKEVVEEEIIEPVRRDVIEPAAEFIEEEIVDPVVENVEKLKEDFDTFVQEALAVTIQAGETINTVIVDTSEKALGLGEHLLTELGVAKEDVVEWLEDTFDWEDILQTHDVILDLFTRQLDQLVNLLPRQAVMLNTVLEDGESAVMRSLDTFGGEQVSRQAPSASISSALDATEQQAEDTLNWLIDKVFGGSPDHFESLNGHSDNNDELLQHIERFIDQFGSLLDDALPLIGDSLQAAFQELGKAIIEPAKALEHLLVGLLQLLRALATTSFSIVKLVAGSLFELFAALVDKVRQLFSEPLEIPVVTELYQTITDGRSLSFASVGALLVAITAAPLLKSLNADLAEAGNSLVPITLANETDMGKILVAGFFSAFQFGLAGTEPWGVYLSNIKGDEPHSSGRKKIGLPLGVAMVNFFLGLGSILMALPLSFSPEDLKTQKSLDDIKTAPLWCGSAVLITQFLTTVANFAMVFVSSFVKGESRSPNRQKKLDNFHRIAPAITVLGGILTLGFYIGMIVHESERADKLPEWSQDKASGAFARRTAGSIMDALPALLVAGQLVKHPVVQGVTIGLSSLARLSLFGIIIGRAAAKPSEL